MTEAPFDLTTFNVHDPAQLQAMREWAGWSWGELSRRMTVAGRKFTASGLSQCGRQLGLPTRGEALAGTAAVSTPEKPDTCAELLEWLKERTVPDAPGPTAATNPGEYATCLVASDSHWPFTHRGAFEVFLGLADRIKPTEIVLDGDVFDFAQVGRYVKDPNAHGTMWGDIQACRRDVLARVNTVAPRAVKRFIVGNHEEGRWRNYLFTRCPEISDIPALTMEAMLGLTEMGWVWQPYDYWPTDALCIYHGDRHTSALGGGSAMSARKEALDMGVSTITGHTHHAGAFFRQDRAGYRVSYEIGGLMDWRAMQAAHVTTRRTPTKAEDWHLACALVRYKPQHSAFRVELIPIIDDGARTFCIWQDSEIVA